MQLGAYKEEGRIKLLLSKIKQLGLPVFTENVDTPQGARTHQVHAFVRGSYGASLTISSQKDIIINGNITNANDSLLALIADQFIRIYHPIKNLDTSNDTCTNDSAGTYGSYLQNPTIVASLFALNHSFMVDNYFCGGPQGTLTVTGSIIQKYRGPVGQGGSSITNGYIKDYSYDDNFRYRSPPMFLDPIQSSWRLLSMNEQVPAT